MADTYTVRPGDSWARIAGLVYGDQRMFQALMAANSGVSVLQPGMVISLPNQQANPVVTVNPAELDTGEVRGINPYSRIGWNLLSQGTGTAAAALAAEWQVSKGGAVYRTGTSLRAGPPTGAQFGEGGTYLGYTPQGAEPGYHPEIVQVPTGIEGHPVPGPYTGPQYEGTNYLGRVYMGYIPGQGATRPYYPGFTWEREMRGANAETIAEWQATRELIGEVNPEYLIDRAAIVRATGGGVEVNVPTLTPRQVTELTGIPSYTLTPAPGTLGLATTTGGPNPAQGQFLALLNDITAAILSWSQSPTPTGTGAFYSTRVTGPTTRPVVQPQTQGAGIPWFGPGERGWDEWAAIHPGEAAAIEDYAAEHPLVPPSQQTLRGILQYRAEHPEGTPAAEEQTEAERLQHIEDVRQADLRRQQRDERISSSVLNYMTPGSTGFSDRSTLPRVLGEYDALIAATEVRSALGLPTPDIWLMTEAQRDYYTNTAMFWQLGYRWDPNAIDPRTGQQTGAWLRGEQPVAVAPTVAPRTMPTLYNYGNQGVRRGGGGGGGGARSYAAQRAQQVLYSWNIRIT